MGQRIPLSICVTATGATITTSGTSSTAAIPNTSGANGTIPPKIIRVVATVAACVRLFPPAGGNAATTDLQVQPGDSVYMEVPAGYTKISAIQVSAPGVVQITPLENM